MDNKLTRLTDSHRQTIIDILTDEQDFNQNIPDDLEDLDDDELLDILLYEVL